MGVRPLAITTLRIDVYDLRVGIRGISRQLVSLVDNYAVLLEGGSHENGEFRQAFITIADALPVPHVNIPDIVLVQKARHCRHINITVNLRDIPLPALENPGGATPLVLMALPTQDCGPPGAAGNPPII